ncbi:MAG TPA: hypothetical protein VHG72_06095, partial [Polyangia bacterium]|nr:hypothetical protein [Polyangia bacterium]
ADAAVDGTVDGGRRAAGARDAGISLPPPPTTPPPPRPPSSPPPSSSGPSFWDACTAGASAGDCADDDGSDDSCDGGPDDGTDDSCGGGTDDGSDDACSAPPDDGSSCRVAPGRERPRRVTLVWVLAPLGYLVGRRR